MAAPADPCMFCGLLHRGSCGETQPRKKPTVRPTAKVAPPTEQPSQPSKLDRMRAAASQDWKPTVEQVPRRRAQPAPPEARNRSYHEALDPDAVAINGAVRALDAAGLLSPKQQTEWSAVLTTKPSLEEEKLLWRMQHKATQPQSQS